MSSKSDRLNLVCSCLYEGDHVPMSAEDAAFTISAWKAEGHDLPDGFTPEYFSETWNALISEMNPSQPKQKTLSERKTAAVIELYNKKCYDLNLQDAMIFDMDELNEVTVGYPHDALLHMTATENGHNFSVLDKYFYFDNKDGISSFSEIQDISFPINEFGVTI